MVSILAYLVFFYFVRGVYVRCVCVFVWVLCMVKWHLALGHVFTLPQPFVYCNVIKQYAKWAWDSQICSVHSYIEYTYCVIFLAYICLHQNRNIICHWRKWYIILYAMHIYVSICIIYLSLIENSKLRREEEKTVIKTMRTTNGFSFLSVCIHNRQSRLRTHSILYTFYTILNHTQW